MENPSPPLKTLPVENVLEWAEKLKKREVQKNPFITSKRAIPDYAKCIGGGLGASAVNVGILYFIDKIDNGYIKMGSRVGIFTLTTLAHRNAFVAGIGGAMGYEILSKLLEKIYPKK